MHGDSTEDYQFVKAEIINCVIEEKQLFDTFHKLMPDLISDKIICTRQSAIAIIDDLSALNDEELNNLKDIFIDDLTEHWNNVKKSSIINDIADFADKIGKIGLKYSLNLLYDYSRKLSLQAMEFDFDNLQETLNNFDYFRETISKYNKSE